MNEVKAKSIVGTGFPPEEGIKLAKVLLEDRAVDWSTLSIDLRDLPASLIISAFFNGFLQQVATTRKELLDAARKIKWALAFDFQRENVDRWMHDFRPYDQAAAHS